VTTLLQSRTQDWHVNRKWFGLVLLIQAALLVAALLVPTKILLLAAAGLAAGLGGVLLLLYPWIIIPLVVATTALDFSGRLLENTAIGVPLTGFHLIYALMLVVLLLNIFVRNRFSFPEFRLCVPFALFLGCIAVSLTYTPNQPEATISFVRTLFLVVFLYVNQVIIDSKRAVALVAGSMAMAIVGGSLLGMTQMISEEFYLPASVVIKLGANTPRATGTFHNPNTFGTFLMVGVVYLTSLLLAYPLSWAKRAPLLLTVAIGMGGLVVTFSRANWLAAFSGIIITLILLKKLRYLFYVSFAGILGILALREFVPFADYVFERFTSIFSLFEEFGSAGRASSSARIYFVMASFKMFFHNPILGVGWRAFPVIFEQYKPVGFPYWLPTRESHTLFATIIAELGLVGALAAGWVLWRTLSHGFTSLPHIKDPYLHATMIALISVFIAFQISLCFTAEFANNFLWLFMGMIFAVPRIDAQLSKACAA
jgi:O-antigen ligase